MQTPTSLSSWSSSKSSSSSLWSSSSSQSSLSSSSHHHHFEQVRSLSSAIYIIPVIIFSVLWNLPRWIYLTRHQEWVLKTSWIIVDISKKSYDTRVQICANCVNFSRKQRGFLHNLLWSIKFTVTNYDFSLKPSKFYTLSYI